MKGEIKKIRGVFPVTIDDAVYISGTTKTIKDEYEKVKKVLDISPEFFGAKGDGINDDSDFIQEAINTCNGGGIVRLPGIYKITKTLILKRGVKLIGTNDGTFTTKSKLLVAISDRSPVIKFDYITTGITIKDLLIKPLEETYNKTFNGIEFNNSEYTEVENVFIDGAKYGFYFSSSTRSNYLVNCNHISAINCDIGIYIQKTNSNSYSNGIYINPKEISSNRIGILAEQGSGNTIEGKNSEVGRNSECGIRIAGGTYSIKGNLWLEGSPIGIEVLNRATLIIDGELYNIKPIIKSEESNVIVNAKQSFVNIIQNKINLDKIKLWFSFDNEDNNVINYVNGELYDNTDGKKSTDSIYGHSSTLKNNFGLNQLSKNFDPSKSWTMCFLLKSNKKTNGSINLFNIQDNNRTGLLFFDINILDGKSITNIRSDEIGNNNLSHENSIVNGYSWIILEYKSKTKTIYSYNSVGNDVLGSNKLEIDLDKYSDCRIMNFCSRDEISYDEIIIFNRELNSSEISTLTNLSSIPCDLKVKNIIKTLETITSYPIMEGEIGVINKSYPYGDVKRYGAIKLSRNESIDDSIAFQNAIDSAYNLGKEVIVSNGIYTIKNTIFIPKKIKIKGLDNKASYRGQVDGTVIETYCEEVFKPKSKKECSLSLYNLFFYNRHEYAILFSGFDFNNTFISKNNFHSYDIIMLSGIGGGNSRFSDNDIQQIKESCFCKKSNNVEITTEAPTGIIDAYIENNYINGFSSYNPIAFNGANDYIIASSKISNNYIDFFKYAFLSPGDNIYYGNIIDYCFRGFAGYMKGAIIKSNMFMHISKKSISRFTNADEQMKKQDWICINTSNEDGENMGLYGAKIIVSSNIINDCDIFYNADGHLLSGIKILEQSYLQDTIIKIKSFIKNGEWNFSDTDNLNDILIEPLMRTEVDELPNPSLKGKTINMFNGREVKYKGDLYKNIDGKWKRLSFEQNFMQLEDIDSEEIFNVE